MCSEILYLIYCSNNNKIKVLECFRQVKPHGKMLIELQPLVLNADTKKRTTCRYRRGLQMSQWRFSTGVWTALSTSKATNTTVVVRTVDKSYSISSSILYSTVYFLIAVKFNCVLNVPAPTKRKSVTVTNRVRRLVVGALPCPPHRNHGAGRSQYVLRRST
jgi:hypothetical protein